MALSSSTAHQLKLSFRSWLTAADLSPSTVRNYVADLNKYLSTVSESQIFSPPSINAYISQITGQKNYRRQLASLAKFCQFALDQHYIDSNPIHASAGSYSFDSLLSEFNTYLQSHQASPSTIKNYINDLRQYLDFISSSLVKGRTEEGFR